MYDCHTVFANFDKAKWRKGLGRCVRSVLLLLITYRSDWTRVTICSTQATLCARTLHPARNGGGVDLPSGAHPPPILYKRGRRPVYIMIDIYIDKYLDQLTVCWPRSFPAFTAAAASKRNSGRTWVVFWRWSMDYYAYRIINTQHIVQVLP